MKKVYKTKVYTGDLHDRNRIHEFEAMLNEEANEGWRVHSVVPQVKNGVTVNVVIFERVYE